MNYVTDSITAYAFRFLMLTVCRTTEVTQAQGMRSTTSAPDYSCIAYEGSVEHVVPLTDEMLTVLHKAKQYNDTPYLFPGKGTRQGLSNNAF